MKLENSKKINKQNFIYISIMIFGLFFGSGNLIFPPLLGKESGENFIIALFFFSLTAIIFPLLAIIAISKFEGIDNLSNRVGILFTKFFTISLYLTIGPGLAIPRNGSLPFAIAFEPYIQNTDNIIYYRLIFTIIFFILVYYLSLNPKKIVVRLGKILTPILLILIIIMFLTVLFKQNEVSKAIGDYAINPAVKGFIEGYNTMDALAGLNFGIVISLTIRTFGIKNKDAIERITLKTGLLAATILFLVYFMLAYVGLKTATLFPNTKNGADILVSVVNHNLGIYGHILLSLIFTIACLSVCIGLITSISQYFNKIYSNISYARWAFIYTLISFVLANFGLNNILKLSIPVLLSIYPVSLVLIVLGILSKYFNNSKLVFRTTIYGTLIISLLLVLDGYIGNIFSFLLIYLPLYSFSLAWLFPSIIIFIFSVILEKVRVIR